MRTISTSLQKPPFALCIPPPSPQGLENIASESHLKGCDLCYWYHHSVLLVTHGVDVDMWMIWASPWNQLDLILWCTEGADTDNYRFIALKPPGPDPHPYPSPPFFTLGMSRCGQGRERSDGSVTTAVAILCITTSESLYSTRYNTISPTQQQYVRDTTYN